MKRMHFGIVAATALAAGALLASQALAKKGATAPSKAEVGKPAPDFTLKDLDGKTVKLSSFRGKTVVLEWFNPECPFVKYCHGEGPLKEMARRYQKKGVVWLAINSGAPGKQGHGTEVNAEAKKKWAMSHPILVDAEGQVGKTYGARTTPHVFVIDKKGILVYAGGVDNAPFGKAKGGEVVGYLEKALDAVLAGKKVEIPESQPYGCSVKYSS